MSDSNDTSVIDEKKIESEGGSTDKDPNYGKFLSSLLIIVFVLIYFSFSSFILYACKIAQSNVLPTDTNCYPYTDNKPEIKPIETNIFKTLFNINSKGEVSDPLSMKLNIPYNDKNSKNSILDTIRQYKNSPSAYFLINYFISIFETLVSSNFAIFNYLFNGFNKIPEILIVLIGPIIFSFIVPLVTMFNCLYGIYLWFSNMSWFFKKNMNDDSKGTPKWEDVSFLEPINYGCAIGLVILFTILLFVVAPYVWFGLVSMIFVLLTIVSYTGSMNNKNIGIFDIVLELLKFYKVSIVTIICLFVISSAFATLGATSGFIGIVVLFLIWYGLISINLFNATNPINLTPLVSDEQASKSSCSAQSEKKEKHGLLYNLIFGGQTGGSITKDLKKLNKHMNRK
jgi:hypothetical protein